MQALTIAYLYLCTIRFFPWICAAIRPLLSPLSVFVTALCVGSPLAINIEAILSPFGLTILLLIIGFHASSFVVGYILTGLAFQKAPDVKALQRTLSFTTGLMLFLSHHCAVCKQYLGNSCFLFFCRNAEQSSSSCTGKQVFPGSTCGCASSHLCKYKMSFVHHLCSLLNAHRFPPSRACARMHLDVLSHATCP